MKEFNLIDSNPETILADALRFHEEITGERLGVHKLVRLRIFHDSPAKNT